MINASNFGAPTLERNLGVSKTVPDMSLSLRQMIDRHLSGGRVKTFEPVYVGENSLIPPGFERMDNIAKVALGRELGEFVRTTRGRLISARQHREKLAAEQEIIERYKRSVDGVDAASK